MNELANITVYIPTEEFLYALKHHGEKYKEKEDDLYDYPYSPFNYLDFEFNNPIIHFKDSIIHFKDSKEFIYLEEYEDIPHDSLKDLKLDDIILFSFDATSYLTYYMNEQGIESFFSEFNKELLSWVDYAKERINKPSTKSFEKFMKIPEKKDKTICESYSFYTGWYFESWYDSWNGEYDACWNYNGIIKDFVYEDKNIAENHNG